MSQVTEEHDFKVETLNSFVTVLIEKLNSCLLQVLSLHYWVQNLFFIWDENISKKPDSQSKYRS